MHETSQPMTRYVPENPLAQLNMFADEPATVGEKNAESQFPFKTYEHLGLTGGGDGRASFGNWSLSHMQRLTARPIAASLRAEFPFRGLVIDTETTGLDHRKDEIIEIGAVAFTFDETGAIGDVAGIYGGLQQPSIPISADITRLTGITNEMVEGQVMRALRSLIEPADLVIAHNAGFDRPFCEAFSPVFSGKAWACSHSEIDW
jgi:DNA polymerase-3 subunit epsilon